MSALIVNIATRKAYLDQLCLLLRQNTSGGRPPTVFDMHLLSSDHTSTHVIQSKSDKCDRKRVCTSAKLMPNRQRSARQVETKRLRVPTKQFNVNCDASRQDQDMRDTRIMLTCTARAVLPTPPSPSTATLHESISGERPVLSYAYDGAAVKR
jgi:hypothetical protein